MSILEESIWILVPKQDITNAMINRSTSCVENELVSKKINIVEYYVLEVRSQQLDVTAVFDNYIWYTKDGILKMINS